MVPTDRKDKLLEECNREYYRKQMILSINNSIDVEDRIPVPAKYVQANIPFQINIRMVDLHVKHSFTKYKEQFVLFSICTL